MEEQHHGQRIWHSFKKIEIMSSSDDFNQENDAERAPVCFVAFAIST
jgi:hypothetical protein